MEQKNKKKAKRCTYTDFWFLWQPDCFVLITGECGLFYGGGVEGERGLASRSVSNTRGKVASAAVT